MNSNRRDFIHGPFSSTFENDETIERRQSIRSIKSLGNAFKTEDEEGEIFNHNYLGTYALDVIESHDNDQILF